MLMNAFAFFSLYGSVEASFYEITFGQKALRGERDHQARQNTAQLKKYSAILHTNIYIYIYIFTHQHN